MNGGPLVTVIIPVRDDPEGIRRALGCLALQTLGTDRFEVVIGDDGSRPKLISQVEINDAWVRVVRGPPRTSYAARNMAVNVSRGKVLAFCDADCLPGPQWLAEGLAAIKHADVVAGEARLQAPDRPTVWSLLTIDLFLDQQQNVMLSRGVTANLFVRRKIFEDCGGFDQSLPSGGDYDFVGRIIERGARLKYSPLAVVGHPTMDRARPFLKKIFITNFWSGARHARNRDKLDFLGVLILVPILGGAIARHRALRPLFHLHRKRLKSSQVMVRPGDHVLAVLALYSIVSLIAGSGRGLGWLKGIWLARSGVGPDYPSFAQQSVLETCDSKGDSLWL